MLQGAASTVPPDDSKTLPKRVGRVTILGVNDRFWRDKPPLGADFWKTADEDRGGVVLNAALATELRVRVGSKVKLHVQKHEMPPRAKASWDGATPIGSARPWS